MIVYPLSEREHKQIDWICRRAPWLALAAWLGLMAVAS